MSLCMMLLLKLGLINKVQYKKHLTRTYKRLITL